MSDRFSIRYRLTEDLWRRFYEAHYAADRGLKIRYIWGGACILIGSISLALNSGNPLIPGALLATGFYGVLSRSIFVLRSVARARRHPFFGQELLVEVSPDGIEVRSGQAGYDQPWQNFVAYRRTDAGFLLYHDRTAFFFVPGEALTPQEERFLLELLARAKVPQLAGAGSGET